MMSEQQQQRQTAELSEEEGGNPPEEKEGEFDCRLVRTIFIFCCPSSIFTRPENQILIPDWTDFHCPGATLVVGLLAH